MSVPFVVLEDDPTGVQLLTGVPLLTRASPAELRAAAGPGPRAIHVLTNSRALAPEAARSSVSSAARAVAGELPGSTVVLRGDSTLRAHLIEEHRAVAEAVAPGREPVLVLCPALPSAGRVTVGGVHWLQRSSGRVPMHETEYARDGDLAYGDSRLLHWAAERSGGALAASDGSEMSLEELRNGGPEAVARALASLAAKGRPAVFAPDTETAADQALIAAGVRAALAFGVPLVVRASPSFAGALCGTLAEYPASFPRAERLLVVCGSYVPGSTRQLEALVERYPRALVELSLDEPSDAGLARSAEAVRGRLTTDGLAVLATPRRRPSHLQTLAGGATVMAGLVEVVRSAHAEADVVITKGGITSASVLRDGLRARRADVLGPLLTGVALLAVHAPGSAVPLAIVPGNVGEDTTLLHLVERMRDPAVLLDTV